jgi:hypothetical protein
MRSRRDRLARPAAAKKRSTADEAFHVASKYLSERGAAASGESGGR